MTRRNGGPIAQPGDLVLPPAQPIPTRPIPIGWKSAPLDMQMAGFRGMVVVHIPFKREFTETQRKAVERGLADGAVQFMHEWEERVGG